jgi:hypothetical protein
VSHDIRPGEHVMLRASDGTWFEFAVTGYRTLSDDYTVTPARHVTWPDARVPAAVSRELGGVALVVTRYDGDS